MRLLLLSVALRAAVLTVGADVAHAADPAIELSARGVQVYACDLIGTAYGWRFVGPEAILFEADATPAGRHFAGPTWQANDGSMVAGEVLGTAAAPVPGAIPWLVLRAKSHGGQGRFASVAFVVRSRTDGGIAPAAGCDAARRGLEARVPYTATYTLFPQSGP